MRKFRREGVAKLLEDSLHRRQAARECRLKEVKDERVQGGSIRQRLIVPVITTNSNPLGSEGVK